MDYVLPVYNVDVTGLTVNFTCVLRNLLYYNEQTMCFQIQS